MGNPLQGASVKISRIHYYVFIYNHKPLPNHMRMTLKMSIHTISPMSGFFSADTFTVPSLSFTSLVPAELFLL